MLLNLAGIELRPYLRIVMILRSLLMAMAMTLQVRKSLVVIAPKINMLKCQECSYFYFCSSLSHLTCIFPHKL
jgi:hypothetical protein